MQLLDEKLPSRHLPGIDAQVRCDLGPVDGLARLLRAASGVGGLELVPAELHPRRHRDAHLGRPPVDVDHRVAETAELGRGAKGDGVSKRRVELVNRAQARPAPDEIGRPGRRDGGEAGGRERRLGAVDALLEPSQEHAQGAQAAAAVARERLRGERQRGRYGSGVRRAQALQGLAALDVRGVLVAGQERRERLGRGRVRCGARHRVGEPDIGRQGLHRARRQVSAHGPPPGRRRRLGVLIGYAAKRSGIGKAEPFPQVRVGDPTSLPVPAGRRGEQHAHGAAAGVEGQGAASAPVVYADVGERAPGAHHLSRRRAERGGFEAVAAEMRAQGYVGVVTGLLGGHVRAGGEHLRREPVGETFGASGVAERRLAGDEQAGLVDELLVEDARRPVAPSVAGTPARGEHLPRRAISPALDSALIGADGRYHLAGLDIPVVGQAVRDEAPMARDRVEGLGELAVGDAAIEGGGP